MKREAAQYNQRIGDLVVAFLDYFQAHEMLMQEGDEPWNFAEGLENFALEKNLTSNELFQVALFLQKKDYPIKAEEFKPERIKEEEVTPPTAGELSQQMGGTIFDRYFKAIEGERYEEAHQIFEQMSDSQKQVIKDQSRRKVSMSKEQKKTAQEADVEGVIEKEIPVEPATKTVEDIGLRSKNPQTIPEHDPTQLTDAVQGVLDQAWALGIPPQLSLPLAATLDQFRVDKSDFNSLYTKFKTVLDHLRSTNQPNDEAERILEEFKRAKDVPMKTVTQLLNLANTLDKLGICEAADDIDAFLKTAAYDLEFAKLLKREKFLRHLLDTLLDSPKLDKGQVEQTKIKLDDIQDQILARKKEFDDKQRGRGVVEEAEDIVHPDKAEVMDRAQQLVNPQQLPVLEQFRLALMSDQFEKAEELFKQMSPDERKMSRDISREYHKAVYLAKVHKVGKTLFDKGRYSEAATINGIVRAQMVGMDPEMQEQVILILIPQDGSSDLPQGFQNQQRRDPTEILKRMEDMTQRLNMEPEPESTPCPCGGSCGCNAIPPGVVANLLEVANQLDAKGLTTEADLIDKWLKTSADDKKKRPVVNKTTCQTCGKELFYRDPKDRPKYCDKCQTGPWAAGAPHVKGSLNPTAALPGPYDPYAKGPLGLSSAEKAREQEARKTRLIDPTGVHGQPIERPESVTLYQDNKPITSIPRARAIVLDREGKIELDWIEGKLCGMVKDPSVLQEIEVEAKAKIQKSAAEDDHGGKPEKVIEIADAIRRDNPDTSDEVAYREAWETYCSYVNPSYEGCTGKGKSERESPKPYSKAAQVTQNPTNPTTASEVLSTLSAQGGNLSQIDDVLKGLSPGMAQKIKKDMVDYLAQRFIDEHKNAEEVLNKPPLDKDNWQKLFKDWEADQDMMEGTSFGPLVEQKVRGMLSNVTAPNREDMLPGETTQDWFRRKMKGSAKSSTRKAAWEEDESPGAGEGWKGGQIEQPIDPLQPKAIVSTLAMQNSNLDKVDTLLKDLDPTTAQKVKNDIVDYLVEDFEGEHEQAAEALSKPPVDASNWEQLWKDWIKAKNETVLPGTSFEKLVEQRLRNKYTMKHHEEISEPMPGEVPSPKELEQMFASSKRSRRI